jgi:hypothetical protein
MSDDLMAVLGRDRAGYNWHILHPDGRRLDAGWGCTSQEKAVAAAQQSKDKLTDEV